jgi:uncharacterized ion transporter superfamily protein YfcC
LTVVAAVLMVVFICLFAFTVYKESKSREAQRKKEEAEKKKQAQRNQRRALR